MSKKYGLLPAGISLFAGLVVSIAMLISKSSPLYSLIMVFSFLLVFYILGSIFRWLLIKFETKPEKKEKKEEKEEQTEDVSTENEEGWGNL